MVHVYHHVPPARPTSVKNYHINVHQNQRQNLLAHGGAGGGSGSGAAASASNNAVVNVFVNDDDRVGGRGGTLVRNSLGSQLEARAAGIGPGGGPSSAGAGQRATSQSTAGYDR